MTDTEKHFQPVWERSSSAYHCYCLRVPDFDTFISLHRLDNGDWEDDSTGLTYPTLEKAQRDSVVMLINRLQAILEKLPE